MKAAEEAPAFIQEMEKAAAQMEEAVERADEEAIEQADIDHVRETEEAPPTTE